MIKRKTDVKSRVENRSLKIIQAKLYAIRQYRLKGIFLPRHPAKGAWLGRPSKKEMSTHTSNQHEVEYWIIRSAIF
jgi:hypothetical protein